MTTTENDLQVHLEAFQANLHGSRILLQGPYSPGKYPPVLEAIQNIREPGPYGLIEKNLYVSSLFYIVFGN
jgi:hypothetical protein